MLHGSTYNTQRETSAVLEFTKLRHVAYIINHDFNRIHCNITRVGVFTVLIDYSMINLSNI